jgi:hypothetical protein
LVLRVGAPPTDELKHMTKGTALVGIPILEAYKAKTMMVFGDAKKVVADMVKAIEYRASQDWVLNQAQKMGQRRQ